MTAVSRRRFLMGIIALAMIPIGLAARYLGQGLAADLSGGVLYAVLFYALFSLIFARASASAIALATLLWCVAVEFFQLTDVPHRLAACFPPVHLIFGSNFAWLDLAAYAVGVLAAWFCDRLLISRWHS